MTSISRPSAATASAAATDFCTVAPQVTIVRSSPGRRHHAVAEGHEVVRRPGYGSLA